MLDDVERDHGPQRTGGNRGERREEIRALGPEPALAADFDHLLAAVDPAPLDPLFFEQRQKLAASAAEIEHRTLARERRQVEAQAFTDVLFTTAITLLEREIASLGLAFGERRR